MFEPPSVLKNIEPTDAVTDPSGVPVPLYISDNAVELTVAAGNPSESNDVIGLKDLFVSLDISNSNINMVKDVIASGEDVSGVVFTRDYYTSSYSNGVLERK